MTRPLHPARHPTNLVPATRSGRAAAALSGVGLAGFIGLFALSATGQTGGNTPSDNWWLAGSGLVGVFGLVLGAAVGLFSVTRRRESSLVVAFGVAAGLLVVFFLAGELLGPP